MKRKLIQNKISVQKSPIHGYGVFAEKDIEVNEIIEECYTLLLEKSQPDFVHYAFSCGLKDGLPLGFGCIYNHSDHTNAGFFYDAERQLMVFKAKRAIRMGEEICTSYGDQWFETRPYFSQYVSPMEKSWHFFSGWFGRGLVAVAGVYLMAYLIKKLVLTA